MNIIKYLLVAFSVTSIIYCALEQIIQHPPAPVKVTAVKHCKSTVQVLVNKAMRSMAH